MILWVTLYNFDELDVVLTWLGLIGRQLDVCVFQTCYYDFKRPNSWAVILFRSHFQNPSEVFLKSLGDVSKSVSISYREMVFHKESSARFSSVARTLAFVTHCTFRMTLICLEQLSDKQAHWWLN
jgi:hypothetical protein